MSDGCDAVATIRDIEAAKETLRAEIQGFREKMDERDRLGKVAMNKADSELAARTAAKFWAMGAFITILAAVITTVMTWVHR